MLASMSNPYAALVAIVITALEEAVLRTTMVYRDDYFRWLIGAPEEPPHLLQLRQEEQSITTAANMFHEMSSIM